MCLSFYDWSSVSKKSLRRLLSPGGINCFKPGQVFVFTDPSRRSETFVEAAEVVATRRKKATVAWDNLVQHIEVE